MLPETLNGLGGTGIADDFELLGEEAGSVEGEEGGVGLLGGKIAGGAEDYYYERGEVPAMGLRGGGRGGERSEMR